MEDPAHSAKSKDAPATCDESGSLNLPTPPEPLCEWTEGEIEPGVMIAAMESMIRVVKLQPDFEARRLERKTAAKFRY